MRELSMHILDIAQNSIAAGAKMVRIDVVEDHAADTMTITVADDGSGMDAGTAQRIRDPFVTSRTTREVGLGIPLFAAAAERCGGRLEIISAPGVGTTVRIVFELSHIDRAPLATWPAHWWHFQYVTQTWISCIIVFREMNPSTSIQGTSGPNLTACRLTIRRWLRSSMITWSRVRGGWGNEADRQGAECQRALRGCPGQAPGCVPRMWSVQAGERRA